MVTTVAEGVVAATKGSGACVDIGVGVGPGPGKMVGPVGGCDAGKAGVKSCPATKPSPGAICVFVEVEGVDTCCIVFWSGRDAWRLAK